MQETSEERPPGSACPGKKRLRCHALHGPTRERGDLRRSTRLYHADNSWHPRTCGDTLLESSSTCAIGSDEVADASRLRLRASGVGVRLLGLRVSQRVCVAACGKRERGQASFEGASPPPRRTQTAAIAEHVSASRSSRHLKLQVRSSRNARYTHAPGPRTRAHAHRARADTRVVLIACTSLAHHPTSQGVRG